MLNALTCALLIMSSLSAEFNPSPYQDKPILSIDVEAPIYEEINELKKVIGIEPGYLFNLNELQAAQKRLYALGRFSDVRVYASRHQQAVEVIFYLQGRKYLKKLDFQGIRQTQKGELQKYLSARSGDELGERFEAKLHKEISSWLSTRGFLEATLSFETVENPAQSENTLVAHIFTGNQTKVHSIAFRGKLPILPEYFTNKIYSRRGKPLNKEELERDRERLEKIFLERGYLRAKVKSAQVELHDNLADVLFEIEPGPRVQIVIAGNEILTRKELINLWPSKNEPMMDGAVELFAAKIKQHYHFLGFPEANIEISKSLGIDKRHETLQYSIREGAQPFIERVELDGVTFFDNTFLLKQIRDFVEFGLNNYASSKQKSLQNLSNAWSSSETFNVDQTGNSSELFISNRWVPRLYKQAVEEIVALYMEHGFLDAKHKACKLKPIDNGNFVARCKLIPGVQTQLKTIRFSGTELVSPEKHFKLIKSVFEESTHSKATSSAWLLSYSRIENGRIKLIRDYRNRGYLYVNIEKKLDFTDGNAAHLNYVITPGPQVQIGRTLIKGNTYTNETLIRNRLSIKSGDIYSLQQAINAQRAISDLGVFRRVRVKLIDEEIPAEQKDLVAEVVERDRQPIELIPGISTADGPRLKLSYSHINVLGTASTFTGSAKLNRQMFFELFGDYAESLEYRYRSYDPSEQFLKAVEREIRFGIRSPKLVDLPLNPLFRFDVIHERENTIPYSLDTAAAILGAEMIPFKNFRLAIEPQVSLTNLECETLLQGEETNDCSGDIFQENNERRRIDKGLRQSAKLGPTLTYDGRDDPINPHKGLWFHTSSQSVTGRSQESSSSEFEPFSYTKIESSLTAYLPLWRATFALSIRGGTILNTRNSAIPIDERFYVGGRDTLRGYIEGTIIPEDVCVLENANNAANLEDCAETLLIEDGGTPISRGGNTFALMKSELRLPFSENFSLGLFVDVGNLWVDQPTSRNLNWRVGTGAGIRYKTPVGALALDWGINPNPRKDYNEEQSNIHFSVGLF